MYYNKKILAQNKSQIITKLFPHNQNMNEYTLKQYNEIKSQSNLTKQCFLTTTGFLSL